MNDRAETSFEGFQITVTRSAEDGVMLVFIDTNDAHDAGRDHYPNGCPIVRVNVNDGEVYDSAEDAK